MAGGVTIPTQQRPTDRTQKGTGRRPRPRRPRYGGHRAPAASSSKDSAAKLQSFLDRIKNPLWQCLRIDDVEPINEPGFFVVLKLCACSQVPSMVLAAVRGDVLAQGGVHHHYVKVPVRIWKTVSEERGWPQREWTIEAFSSRYGVDAEKVRSTETPRSQPSSKDRKRRSRRDRTVKRKELNSS